MNNTAFTPNSEPKRAYPIVYVLAPPGYVFIASTSTKQLKTCNTHSNL